MFSQKKQGRIKVLNLYSGIGGNRKLWEGVDVTAVEINPKIANVYRSFFPNDKVIVCDAHQYLLQHFEEFDFIWSSPPCPTHSRARYWSSKGDLTIKKYPDMSLYQEIIFLDAFAECKWVVENVIGYYTPLIPAKELGGHYFWSNFPLMNIKLKRENIDKVKSSTKRYGFNIKDVKLDRRKDAVIRSIVNPELALHIFRCAFKEKQQRLIV